MPKEIFPVEIVENSQESNFQRHNIRLRIINWIILFSTIFAMSALPLIEVDIGLRSQGLIRPVTNLVQISSPVSGELRQLYIQDNSHVEQGDLIAQIDTVQISEQIRYLKNKESRLILFIQDLEKLVHLELSPQMNLSEFNTARYKRSYSEMRNRLSGMSREIIWHEKELKRQAYLKERDMVSRLILEKAEYNLQSALDDYELSRDQQKSRWQLEKLEFQNELKELQSQLVQHQMKQELYTIRSPVTGSIQNLNAIHRNTFIHLNQVIADISPDTSLIATAYVTPGDIGLLREGMPVRFSIDSYDQNRWGTLEGKVLDISTDAIIMDQSPVFRVLCTFDRNYLELKNGVRGELKKGMTLQARFIIARRSLFQLLFDNVNDWLNPVWYASSEGSQNAGI